MRCSVQSILGVTERELVKLPTIERNAFLENGRFLNRETGQLTSYGNFQVTTVADLRRRVESMEADAPPKELTPLTTESKIDIGELQASLRTNDEAMVQVASNFNCLENGSISRPPDHGFLVDMACDDHTQGPAASFGPLSAYLYRAHFYSGGQTSEKGVNLLHTVTPYFGTPVNGKLLLKGKEVPVEDMDAVVEEICIGLHSDVPVMFGRKDHTVFHNSLRSDDSWMTRMISWFISSESVESSAEEDLYPKVDQVFTASINLRRVGEISEECLTYSGGDRNEALYHMARVLLRASYEATYLAAIAQRRRKLFLTLVGGGCFGNPISIIVEEIERAHRKWAGHPASRLETCQICLYSPADEREVKKYLEGN